MAVFFFHRLYHHVALRHGTRLPVFSCHPFHICTRGLTGIDHSRKGLDILGVSDRGVHYSWVSDLYLFSARRACWPSMGEARCVFTSDGHTRSGAGVTANPRYFPYRELLVFDYFQSELWHQFHQTHPESKHFINQNC